MRKSLLFFIIAGIFLLTAHENNKPAGIVLQDSIYYNKSFVSTDWPLREMVYVPMEKTDKVALNEMIQSLDKLPTKLLVGAYEAGISIQFFERNLTDFPGTVYLQNKVPRGYKNKHTSWDIVPGIGGGKIVYAKVGHSSYGKGHGSINLELHEFAHSLDNYLFVSAWHQVVQYESWREEAAVLFPGKSYFLDYQSEFVAESFAFYYHSKESRSALAQFAPKMYAYLTKIHKGDW